MTAIEPVRTRQSIDAASPNDQASENGGNRGFQAFEEDAVEPEQVRSRVQVVAILVALNVSTFLNTHNHSKMLRRSSCPSS